jgi:hypothetical protein
LLFLLRRVLLDVGAHQVQLGRIPLVGSLLGSDERGHLSLGLEVDLEVHAADAGPEVVDHGLEDDRGHGQLLRAVGQADLRRHASLIG